MATTKKKNTGEVDRFTTNGHGVKVIKKVDKKVVDKINAELAAAAKKKKK